MGIADEFIAKKRQKLEATAQRKKTASEDTTEPADEAPPPVKVAQPPAARLAAPPVKAPAKLPATPAPIGTPVGTPVTAPASVAPTASADEEDEPGPDLTKLVRPREQAAALDAQERQRDLIKYVLLAAGVLAVLLVVVALMTRGAPAPA